MKVMSAIERCRTAALGGHVARCENGKCGHTIITYNSCRNRHCPKCQGTAAREWLEEREAELLPVPYFHVVYTLPAHIADLAYTNKAVIYDILFKASAEATLTIAADPKRLGARIGITSVLHSWGSAMTHHPHVHMIVPGGGLSADGTRWIACRPNFLLPVRVLSRLFRRLVIEMLVAAHGDGKLALFGVHVPLADAAAFATFLSPLRRSDWVVYAKRPFGGPEAVLAYLSRYTHRVAITNRRLITANANAVTFKYKDYRLDGAARFKTMTLATAEFIRRFLSHVLPKGFHRIRHSGLLANGNRAGNVAKARELLGVPAPGRRARAGKHRSQRAEPLRACLSLLRPPYAHHRGLRPRQHAEVSADTGHDQDRYVMTPLAHCAPTDRRRWCTAGIDPAFAVMHNQQIRPLKTACQDHLGPHCRRCAAQLRSLQSASRFTLNAAARLKSP